MPTFEGTQRYTDQKLQNFEILSCCDSWYEPLHYNNNKTILVESKESCQPGLLTSLSRVFATCKKKPVVLSPHWTQSEEPDWTGLMYKLI